MLGKKRKLGKLIEEIKIEDSHQASFDIDDKDLLLYLGLTDDANPLYIQHDYASQTPYKRPLVPSVMLFGVVSSMVSMHLPGPGSHIIKHDIEYPKPVFHYTTIRFTLKVTSVEIDSHLVSMVVNGYDEEGDEVVTGTLLVSPPYKPESMTAQSLENFY